MMLEDKDLKNQILESINDDNIPNFSTAIKAKYLSRKNKKTAWYKSPKLWAIGTPILACGIAVGIIIPTMLVNNGIFDTSDSNPAVVKPLEIKGKKNEIAFGVLSGANLIPDGSIKPSLRLKQSLPEANFKEEITALNPYMSTAEAMLDANLDIAPIMLESDIAEYANKMQINNAGEILTFYYNENSKNPANLRLFNDIDDDDDNDNDDLEDDESENDENEQEYSLTGIFKKDEVTYKVEGKKELELDEYELTLKIYLKENNQDSYILIEQEFEQSSNEQECSYVYSTIEDGKEIFTSEISFESEDDETKVEVEFEASNRKSKFSISKKSDHLLVEYEVEGFQEGEIKVVSSTLDDESAYTYQETESGYVITLKRN